jgi:hypothetical protein
MGISYKGSQGQAEGAAVLQENNKKLYIDIQSAYLSQVSAQILSQVSLHIFILLAPGTFSSFHVLFKTVDYFVYAAEV